MGAAGTRSVAGVAPPRLVRERSELLGIPIDPVDGRAILDYLCDVVTSGRPATILHVNVYGANLAHHHDWLKEFYNSVELVFCDGDGIRLGLRILGFEPPAKTTYNEWIWQLGQRCEQRGLSLYLLGGRPGVATQAAQRLQERFPRLRIAGTNDGYFEKSGAPNMSVVAGINGAKPDVLLVCFGMPLQELWVRENRARLTAPVILTGGAALDYAAGLVAVAPAWMKRSHLEWFFRYLLEPRRMFSRYIIGNPLFLVRVLMQRLRQGRSLPRRGVQP